MTVAGPPVVLPLLVLAALAEPGDASCGCSEADCDDPVINIGDISDVPKRCSVAIAGDLKVVGNEEESSCSAAIVNGAGPYPTDDGCRDAGAVYIFGNTSGAWALSLIHI